MSNCQNNLYVSGPSPAPPNQTAPDSGPVDLRELQRGGAASTGDSGTKRVVSAGCPEGKVVLTSGAGHVYCVDLEQNGSCAGNTKLVRPEEYPNNRGTCFPGTEEDCKLMLGASSQGEIRWSNDKCGFFPISMREEKITSNYGAVPEYIKGSKILDGRSEYVRVVPCYSNSDCSQGSCALGECKHDYTYPSVLGTLLLCLLAFYYVFREDNAQTEEYFKAFMIRCGILTVCAFICQFAPYLMDLLGAFAVEDKAEHRRGYFVAILPPTLTCLFCVFLLFFSKTVRGSLFKATEQGGHIGWKVASGFLICSISAMCIYSSWYTFQYMMADDINSIDEPFLKDELQGKPVEDAFHAAYGGKGEVEDRSLIDEDPCLKVWDEEYKVGTDPCSSRPKCQEHSTSERICVTKTVTWDNASIKQKERMLVARDNLAKPIRQQVYYMLKLTAIIAVVLIGFELLGLYAGQIESEGTWKETLGNVSEKFVSDTRLGRAVAARMRPKSGEQTSLETETV